ncbi:hypothetical protein HOLleu_05962 [Holothuria leucospilota]|uniref:F5/8 type C domain-containing protein n=1 Tax=Holothuria leucospilota TaxID=206669 RepID=A0A9Q1HJC0_HOLLE|nr:hypothetical protein HOLleu_05962 [Holothuria leucospilota]
MVNYGDSIQVSIPADQPPHEVFLHVETTDADKDTRCADVACPCVDTIFSLHNDYGDELFDVKASGSQGALFVKKEAKLEVGRIYDVTMVVHNVDGQQSKEFSAKVQITPPLGFNDDHEENVVLSRSRRAVVSPLDVNDTLTFTLNVSSPVNVTNITAGTHVDVQLTIAIPPAVQIDSMSFEFFAENNVSSFGVVCEPGVKDDGSSITYEEANARLDFNSENYFQAETSYLTLTNITNANSVTEDELSLEFGVTIVNDNDVKFGELNWISVGAEFLDYSRIWVGQVGFYIAPKDAEVVDSPRLDTNGTTSINKGESGVISLLMNIYKHSFNLSVTASVASTTGYHICKFGLRTTGKGYCLENTERVETFTVDSMTGYNTEALFDFREIIYSGENNNDEDSLIVMDLFIQLPDDVSVVGEVYTVTFNVTVDGDVSTISTNFEGDAGVTPTESLVAQPFDVSFPELADGFPYTLNELLELDITLTFPPGVYGNVTIDFQMQGQSIEIPVYSLQVVKIGYNIGCFQTCNTFKPRDVCHPYANLVELLNPTTNRELRFWANDNDVILRAMLRYGNVPLGNQTITAALAVDAANVAQTSLVVDIMQRSSLTPVLPLAFTSTPNELTIVVGETRSHVVNIVLEPDTEFTYTLEFNSSVDWFTIKNVTAVAMGNDIVGDLNDLLPVADFSTGNYKATIDLGFINNIALFSNETTGEDSTISLEVVIAFNDTVSVENGAEAIVDVVILVSDGAPTPTIDQSPLSLTVTAINDTINNITSKFKLECPPEDRTISPGQVVPCTVVMNFTDYREFVVFDVETSPNTTEVIGLMILSVEVLSIGGNLQVSGFPSDVLESSQNSSQMDSGTIDFGFITNTGNSGDPSDDEVIIEIHVQATDTEENVNGTQLLLGTGVSVGDKLVWVAYTTLYINRDGSETPQLNCDYGLEDGAVDEMLHLGDLITYNVTIQHQQGSSFAEALNVSATFFLPPYFKYHSTSAILDHTATTSGQKLIVSIPRLYFSDVFNFTISLSRDCGYMFTLKNDWKATTLLEITYHTHNRDASGIVDGANPLSDVMKDPIKSVSFDFNVSGELISNEGVAPVCLSPTALGMESSVISSCQISSSHEIDPVTGAAGDARRNGPSGWKVGKSGRFAGQRWLKVDVGRLSAITMIQTQGGRGALFEGDIGEYEIFYSKDDVIYRRVFHMNGSNADYVFDHRKGYPSTPPVNYYDLYSTYFLHRPVEARFVIIRLREDNTADSRLFNVLRFELYGCFLEEQQLDVCENRTEKEINTLPEEYDRGFAVDTDNNTLYVCSPTVDNQPGLSEGISDDNTYLFRRGKRTTRCFKTTDTYTWQGLSDNIRCVIGYSPVTGGVYGIAGYVSPVYAVSFDGGTQWSEITNDQFAEASLAVDYESYNELPLESTETFNYVHGDNTTITKGSFEATFNGFKGQRTGSQEKIFDWNTCCQN